MKLFRTNLNILFILMFAFLIMNIRLAQLETDLTKVSYTSELEKLYSNTFPQRKFTPKEQLQFNKIKKPTMPSNISEKVKFLQKELTKAYYEANKKANPRFVEASEANKKFMSLFPEDKREEGLPINREAYINFIN